MISNLIERLEKAEGPDRELDCDIGRIVIAGDHYKSIIERSGDYCIRYYPGPPGPEYLRLPRYTASIDAALTLVLEGVDVELARDAVRPAGKLWFAYLSAGDPVQTKFIPKEGRSDHGPIALCIAALKARTP